MGRIKQRMFSSPDILPRGLRTCFLLVDFAFLIYWTLSFFQLIPAKWLLMNADQPFLVDWNWSFLPLNLLIASTGFLTLFLAAKRSHKAVTMALISLIMTFCAGLQALSFWVLSGDFSWIWWIPNVFLVLYPIPFILFIFNRSAR